MEIKVQDLLVERRALLHKISDLEESLALSQRKFESAMDQMADLRRQKSDLILHQV